MQGALCCNVRVLFGVGNCKPVFRVGIGELMCIVSDADYIYERFGAADLI